MKRRHFLQKAALSASLPFWLQSCSTLFKANYPVTIQSDQATGHLVFASQNWKKKIGQEIETAIVGGGVAGLAAAYQLRNTNFCLFELSQHLGGSSGSHSFGGVEFCQGAHYDLDYPEYYGEETLGLLEEIGVITYEPWKKAWSFVDRQHIIPPTRKQHCFENGQIRSEVISDGPEKKKFLEILSPFLGEMKQPSRLIDSRFHYLNDLTFLEFVKANMQVSDSLKRKLDYHMLDDYGGTSDQVSALAGIHYFMCRPYYSEPVNLFSPPEGNNYFIKRISRHLPAPKLKTSHLVSAIHKKQDHFLLEVLDLQAREILEIKAEKVIYAGQKHALKYIYPSESKLFDHVSHAPWMVVNLLTRQTPGNYGYWQNEFLGATQDFLGFVDSSVQDQSTLKNHRVFTAYYCLKPEDRKYFNTIEDNASDIASRTQKNIEQFLGHSIEVERAFLRAIGHAMPIPTPGYLFRDNQLKEADLLYAGVDSGRLPLLFEALDSGICAARRTL